MAIVTKTNLLSVVTRAYGPEHAEALKESLPERLDLENPADTALLLKLGLTLDGLFDALGAEF